MHFFLLFTTSTNRKTLFCLQFVEAVRSEKNENASTVSTNRRTFFFFCSAVCTNRRTVANFFSSAVCTNRRTIQNFFSSAACTNRRTKKIFLLFYNLYKPQKRKVELPTVSSNRRTVWQWKKLDHCRPPPPIHHNYLYNLKLNLQWYLSFFQLL